MVRNLFFLGIILAASGLLSPPLALACGIAYGLLATHEYHADARRLSRFLLPASVVCLGFVMNFGEVIRVCCSAPPSRTCCASQKSRASSSPREPPSAAAAPLPRSRPSPKPAKKPSPS